MAGNSNPNDTINIYPLEPGFNDIPKYAIEDQVAGTTMAAASASSGTEQCPWCYRVWNWFHPLPGNNSPCPRCGQTMSIGAKEFCRLPDLDGQPSD